MFDMLTRQLALQNSVWTGDNICFYPFYVGASRSRWQSRPTNRRTLGQPRGDKFFEIQCWHWLPTFSWLETRWGRSSKFFTHPSRKMLLRYTVQDGMQRYSLSFSLVGWRRCQHPFSRNVGGTDCDGPSPPYLHTRDRGQTLSLV